ncbi:hypothetical protein Xbed_03363 [Xenorhabdus beddingii]|uniref:Levan regulatory protein n=1 Tax=Xenorhabdus beddingii TaxID=40578 RepID=A0A1Y2SFT6_9GAMM|nr:hypothetical protein [Xenorhabdus beddingii]OTA17209.1 hypothetical protein Xbed_03363 [Xenorhabdus beddingii]
MSDFFSESISLERIDLLLRLATKGECNHDERYQALIWCSELTTQLIKQFDENETKPLNSGSRLDLSGTGLQ